MAVQGVSAATTKVATEVTTAAATEAEAKAAEKWERIKGLEPALR